MYLQLPTELVKAIPVLDRLLAHGYEAVFVGGAVRDTILGLQVSDVDIATSATPHQVMGVFERVVPTGLQHGTVTVLYKQSSYEVTTYRTEGTYVDSRRPASVQFVNRLEDDLSRRDFTMNAMALTNEGEVLDPFFGYQHLLAKKLYAVGDPAQRFEEDALRMLRAIRFIACYELQPAPSVWRAITEHGSAIRLIAMERVQVELDKLLQAQKPDRAVGWLLASRLLLHVKEPLFPDINLPKANATEDLSALALLHCVDMRWAALLIIMQRTKEQTLASFRALRFAKKRAQEISAIVEVHELVMDHKKRSPQHVSQKTWVTIVISMGQAAIANWLQIAQLLQQNNQLILEKKEIKQYNEWFHAMPIYHMKQLDVNGNQLMAHFAKRPGAWINNLLYYLLQAVVCHEITNEYNELLRYAEMWRKEVDVSEQPIRYIQKQSE
ncbi:CCA tRNA nucleotidyltransferase [Paenibacillus yanchengensis]|uniref:CCA tRNA nucleotidyltransferase n=1 Tax=Paenibacillus yanchengensis TaxID=2035833 RepID=A0ABW4YJM4_9BACL